MGSHITLIAAGALIAFVAIHEFIIKPAFLSPLSKIPAPHWSCHVAPFWLWWAKLAHKENRIVYDGHMSKGKALRLAPDVVSLNCFDGGLKQVYLGGFPKPDFYFNGFANYNTHNIFTFKDNATHSARKRIISGTFSKSFILSDPSTRATTRNILYGRLLPIIARAAEQDQALEVLELFFSYSMDSFVSWQFGKSTGSNFLQDEKERRRYLDAFFAAVPYTFWQWHLPRVNAWLKFLGIIPKKVDEGFADILQWNLDMCDGAQALLASTPEEDISDEDRPVVMSLALKAMSDMQSKPGHYPQRIEIASDMFAHNSAAFETSGITLTMCLWELSRRPELQAKLRQELLTLDPPFDLNLPKSDGGDWEPPTPSAIDKLPLLEAVIMETLRLHASVPGGQPRTVPKPCSLGGYDNIPAGITVQCYAYSLHRTPEIFPDPYEWKPKRWIESSPQQLSQMRRWFWAFGSGGRMCIGSNFSYFSMKAAIGSIYTNYTTEVHDHGIMELEDSYMAAPQGYRLEIKFKPVEQ